MTLQITQTLTVPDSSAGRAAFVAAANNFGNNLTPWANQANAMAAEMNDNATAAALSKAGAEAAQGLAEAARDAAIDAATFTADDYNPSSHAYAKNDLSWDGDGLYRCILAYTSTATLPSADASHWQRVNVSPSSARELASDVPVNVQAGAYTLALSDRGKNVQAGGTITIPAKATVAFQKDHVIVITNLSATARSIAPAAGVTLRLAGTATTGARTLAAYGKCSLSCEADDVWMAAGVGLT